MAGLGPLRRLQEMVLSETTEIAADLSGIKGLYLTRLKPEAERPATP